MSRRRGSVDTRDAEVVYIYGCLAYTFTTFETVCAFCSPFELSAVECYGKLCSYIFLCDLINRLDGHCLEAV